MSNATPFGELLRHLRQRARLTQDELGLAVGYSRAHIARLENGQRVPDPGAVRALLGATARATFFSPCFAPPCAMLLPQLLFEHSPAHEHPRPRPAMTHQPRRKPA